MRIPDYKVKTFENGFVTNLEEQSVKDGVATDGLNWVFLGDSVELRRGYKLLGTDAGAGKITGVKSATKSDGTEVLFRTRARKIEYYNETTEDWVECGSDVIAVGGNGEEFSIEPYQNLAGAMVYFSSPNSSVYRIMTANPTSVKDLATGDFRGYFRIKNNRVLLWNRISASGSQDLTGVYGSKLEKDSYADFTFVDDEAIGGAGATRSGTLAFKAGNAKNSCFGVVITDGVETFTDDFNGVLVSSLGATNGTINYETGAYSVTFASAPGGVVTADYYHDNPTSSGIWDFGYSATRLAGEGFIIRQDDGGGKMLGLGEFESSYYCIHEKKGWKLTISADDSTASNIPYRDGVGTTFFRSVTDTGDGIYYIDSGQQNNDYIKISKLHLDPNTGLVEPQSITDLVDLSGYNFDNAQLYKWGDYILVACATSDSLVNNRLLSYDVRLKLWNTPFDYWANVVDSYNGALVGGDSTLNNVYELFSGFDDDDSNINNSITFNRTNLGVDGLKKANRLVVEGNIQIGQVLKVYLSFDDGSFIEVAEIRGDGDYVDTSESISIGKQTIGKKTIGGGDVVSANHYKFETKINTDKFENAQFKFIATGLGYVSITEYGLKDIRYKGRKSPSKYIE